LFWAKTKLTFLGVTLCSGEKHTNWQGGMRAAAFISGGLIPQKLRGTSSNFNSHIVDWYPTFCGLAGIDGKDDPPVAPLPVDPADPTKDIYGKDSYPPLDGVDVWGLLIAGETNRSAAHAYLVLSKEVILAGDHKLIVAQNFGWPHDNDNGWMAQNSSKFDSTGASAFPCSATDSTAAQGELPGVPGQIPCLFDTTKDESERSNLAAGVTVAQVQAAIVGDADTQPASAAMVADLWDRLNRTVLTAFCKNITKANYGTNGCGTSPKALLGNCDKVCAGKYWKAQYGPSSNGPYCGVPGCNGTGPGP
jgi:hypothetical protein